MELHLKILGAWFLFLITLSKVICLFLVHQVNVREPLQKLALMQVEIVMQVVSASE